MLILLSLIINFNELINLFGGSRPGQSDLPGQPGLELDDTYNASDHMPRIVDIYFNIGDVNLDGYLDVSDVVLLVSIIMDGGDYIASGDINGDNYLNVLDVVLLVNAILEG